MKRLGCLVLSVTLLVGVVWYAGGVTAIIRPILTAEPLWVAMSFAVATLDRLLMTVKWIGLLRSQGALLGVVPGLKIYCTAMVVGLVLPSTMGADAARVILTVRRGLERNKVLASVVVERVVGFIAALLLGLGGLALLNAHGLLDSRFTGVGLAGTVALAATAVLFALSLSERLFAVAVGRLPARVTQGRVASMVQCFHRVYAGFRTRRGTLVTFFALTLLEQIITILYTWCTARAVGVDVSLVFMAGVLPLTLLVSRLPISFDGLGVFEVVFIALMSLGGVTPAEAISVAVMGRIVQTLAWLPWSLAQSLDGHMPPRLGVAAATDAGPPVGGVPENVEPRP